MVQEDLLSANDEKNDKIFVAETNGLLIQMIENYI